MSILTPVGILLLTVLGKSLNLTIIYIILGLMGFTYNARASTSYIFGNEFTKKENHMAYSVSVFVFSGLFQAASGWYFWYFRSQQSYCYLLSALLILAILWVAIFAPESPHYLLEKFDYVELKACLLTIAKMNKYKGAEEIDGMVAKLKVTAEKQYAALVAEQNAQKSELEAQSTEVDKSGLLFKNARNKRNMLAVCLIWSIAGFLNYFLLFYSKYFKGNFYINYST